MDNNKFKLLTKVLDDLSDFLPYLVLVGGWVPFIYSRYLWKIKQEPLATVDIDFGFRDVAYSGRETIASRVRNKRYDEHHVAMDRLHPFVPIVKLEKENLRADVEFITAPETSDDIKKKLIGEEIKVNTIENFDILFQSPVEAAVERNLIKIPNPAIFAFHKLLTFSARGKDNTRRKDLYYAYYVLFFSPEKAKLHQDISGLIQTLKQGSRVRQNVEEYFKDPHDKGPAWLDEVTRGSVIQTLVGDVRGDAFQRIANLIRLRSK